MIGALLLLASTVDDGWPPPRYRGDVSARVHFVAPELISALCDDTPNPPDVVTDACSEGFDIWVPNPCGFRGEYARRLCHELGHVNGWSDNHPGSRSHK